MKVHDNCIYINLKGRSILENPLLNKGSAFSKEERTELDLHGLLPHNIESLDEQCRRSYKSFSIKPTPILKHIYLRSLQDTNEVLFYALINRHLQEILPIIYTPIVGQSCQRYSDLFRRPRGLYISYPDRNRIEYILENFKSNVEVLVITDGERVLGLGDQGVGGMSICIGKLSLYSAIGGISPNKTLPIMLDCGTNNKELLDDPSYLGWRHERISDKYYYEFVDMFIQALKRRWEHSILQFEDFAINHATPLLEKYRNNTCCFNDDIQGTAGVTAATLQSAGRVANKSIKEMSFVFLGSGSAGCGIAEQLVRLMIRKGIPEETARIRIFMVDRYGLVHNQMKGLRSFQQKLAHDYKRVASWNSGEIITLEDVITHAKPDALIGVSGQPGLFTKRIIEKMIENHDRPIIFPLSNPITHIEATPEDIIKWSNGKALIATGSPFDSVLHQGNFYQIAQCNNIYFFPGLGLGVLASGAKRISDGMLDAAVEALALLAPAMTNKNETLLPLIEDIQSVTPHVAHAVALQAHKEGLASFFNVSEIERRISEKQWKPIYRRMRLSL